MRKDKNKFRGYTACQFLILRTAQYIAIYNILKFLFILLSFIFMDK
jgi:hypothetical protein